MAFEFGAENRLGLLPATGPSTLIPRFREEDRDSIETMAKALLEHGVMILERGEEFRAAALPLMREQLEALLAGVQPDPHTEDFPGNTKRILGLAGKMESVQPFVIDSFNVALAEEALKENCERVQLHVAQALCPGPGAKQQPLHRDSDFDYPHLKRILKGAPMPYLVVAGITALVDFRPENGATLVVPGSHQWPQTRQPLSEEIVAAAMPAGSTLYYLASLLHGAGPNTTEDVYRSSVILAYSAAWLRQQENQYLTLPPEAADKLPLELRSMLGYSMHGHALGLYDKELAKSKYTYGQNNAKRKKTPDAKL